MVWWRGPGGRRHSDNDFHPLGAVMCGIVGKLSFRSSPELSDLRRAVKVLQRRGPDDEGFWAEGPVAFGHRRLAILDLSPAGHQPMVSAEGRFVIVLNGEVYNYRELREKLAAPPGGWKSDSDTEVILGAYARWGPDCLQYFHGMFALAIWDRQEQTLFVARDRMGVKPLYYHSSNNWFGFSSRPGALFALQPELSAAVDEQGMRLYFEAGYIPAPYSFWRQVRKLRPAHYLLISASGVKEIRYWDYRQIEPDRSWETRPEEELLDELEEIVFHSVRSRLVAHVPVGVFLSGGIDSSLVVAMMTRASTGPVKTFTIGFSEQEHDESAEAAAVAQHLGTDHRCETLRPDDLLALLPDYTGQYDEPFFDFSAFPTMAVSRLARRAVTVSLSGDGGDELFGGYHYYNIMARLESAYAMPPWVRRTAGSVTARIPGHRSKLLAAALRRPDAISAFAFIRGIAKDFPLPLSPEVMNSTTGLAQLFTEAARGFASSLSAVESAMRLDAAFTLPDDYLQKVDVASMAFSLESREPLLDHSLVEWCMRLPLGWKLRGRTPKYLLRKLAYRCVSREILERPKRGFGVPMDRWLRGPLREWARALIEESPSYAEFGLDQQRVRELFAVHLSGRRSPHPLLWATLVLLNFRAQRPQPEASLVGSCQ